MPGLPYLQTLLQRLPVRRARYEYSDETGINPYWHLASKRHAPICQDQAFIFALREDGEVVLGVKNPHEEGELKFDCFLEAVAPTEHHDWINWTDRYGHPGAAFI